VIGRESVAEPGIAENPHYKLTDRKLTLYNVPWQALRVSLLGHWTSVDGTMRNLKLLSKYLTTGGATASKFWRVLNLLNATRMGYSGQGKEGSEEDKIVQYYRDGIQRFYQIYRKRMPFDVDTPEQIRNDWKKLDKATQKAIYTNLAKRLDLHKESQHRNELRYFIDVITDKYIDEWK
jgi:hypothetical protein